MKYIVTESQYKKLNEEVGVPTNIVKIAQKLFDKIMSKLKPNVNLGIFLHKPITLKGDFQINDYKFDTIKVTFNADSLDDYHVNDDSGKKVYLLGMTHVSSVEMTDDFNYVANRKMHKIDLKINMAIDNDITAQDLIDEFNKERTVLVSSLAHEIKHAYDEFADPKLNTEKRVDYNIGSQRRFGDITPLNTLLSYMYFAHNTENLVRATEIFTALEEEGITKGEFYNFLTNHKVYENYRRGANLTYENLKKDLKSMVPKIKETFDDNNIDYDENASDDEIVEMVLIQFFNILLQWKAGDMKQFLTKNMFEGIYGFSEEKQKRFDRYLDKITKFGGNYENFFNYEIKKIRNICLKMTKKLSKLYSLLKEKNNPL
jgi:hypothetical protein